MLQLSLRLVELFLARPLLELVELLLPRIDLSLRDSKLGLRLIEIVRSRRLLREQRLDAIMLELRELPLRLRQFKLLLRRRNVFVTRPLHQLSQRRFKLIELGFRLSNLFGSIAVRRSIALRLSTSQFATSLREQLAKLKRFQFDERLARLHRLAFDRMHASDSPADSRADPDFVRFNEPGNFRSLVPLLAPDQQRH